MLEKYFKKFHDNVIGLDQTFESPYGPQKIIYADWTASGRQYRPIEEKLVNEIEGVRAKLRIVHLSTHLKTPNILTERQIALYNELRGYSKDPYKNVPEGHNPEMWKKHNGCS